LRNLVAQRKGDAEERVQAGSGEGTNGAGYSGLQRQAAEFKSGLPDTCLGPAGWPQSKVSAKATTVAPDGFRVVSDLL
jgi:hypothetical protein